jgi:hypothetical protein
MFLINWQCGIWKRIVLDDWWQSAELWLSRIACGHLFLQQVWIVGWKCSTTISLYLSHHLS